MKKSKLEGNDDIFNMTYRNNKDKPLPEVNIPMFALVLKVRKLKGDTVECDISCNSNYILAASDRSR